MRKCRIKTIKNMTSLLLAFQFLTIFPIKLKHVKQKEIASSLMFFPFVGLVIGLLLCGLNVLLEYLHFSQLALNVILVVALVVITGGMHLDGLSDTLDGFWSARSKEDILRIMRDPHIGVMGVLSLICIILLKVVLLNSLGSVYKIIGLLLLCIISRWTAVLAMYLFNYARSDGKAKIFIDGINSKIFFSSTLSAIAFAFVIWGWNGISILFVVAGLSYLICNNAKRKIGGITGDILGALIEISEVIILFVMGVLLT